MTRKRLFNLGLACVVFATSCVPKPVPFVPNDGRPCLLAIVGEDAQGVARAFHPQARPGDVLVAQWCLHQQADDLLNEIERLAR